MRKIKIKKMSQETKTATGVMKQLEKKARAIIELVENDPDELMYQIIMRRRNMELLKEL